MSFLKPYEGKMIVLTSRNCPHCRTYKEKIEANPELKDKTVYLNIEESKVAQALVTALDIRAIPTLIGIQVGEPQDGKIKICKIDKEMKVEACLEIKD